MPCLGDVGNQARGCADHQGGPRTPRCRITAAVNAARRHTRAQAAVRHGALPGIRLADKVLDGVVCIRLDATVTGRSPASSPTAAPPRPGTPAPAVSGHRNTGSASHIGDRELP